MADNAVERLFSLFASSDGAEALAGDLAEERAQRGWMWYWLHVVRVTFTLCRNGVAEAPLRVVALMLAGAVLFIAPAIAGVAGVYLLPMSAVWVSWIALSFFWWGGALFTGASLVTIAPHRGMPACTIVAVAGAALLLGFGATVDPQEFTRTDRMFFITALGTTVALLAGGAIARRRTVVIAVPFAAAVGLAAMILFLMAGASSSAAESNGWRDPSPHKTARVTVEDGVRLEVLDWGGSGPALILLAGLSDTAHVFDEVAPRLTKRFRVVGVTRRGHPGSSAPASGYGFVRLAEDVMRVSDETGLKNPVVVGHSFAGEEMHVLGARYSDRIAGLVYVDAAFDRGDRFEEHEAAARGLPGPPNPEGPALASFAALRAFLTSTQGAPGPEGRLRARYVANADGSVRGRWMPEPHVLKAFSGEMQAAYKTYNPERIRVPALAIYAVPRSADELMRPWYDANDPAVRKRVEALYPLERENVARHARWFAAFAERGRVSELSGGHDLIVSNPREVLEEIEAFVKSLHGPTSDERASSR
jgi:pimeloyl-ACP methyl ester carboxylesterase